MLGTRVVAGGFSLTPLHPGVNEGVRKSAVEQLFKEYDKCKLTYVDSGHGAVAVFMAGGVKPNTDIDQMVAQVYAAAGL